jgi:hypothetical protein
MKYRSHEWVEVLDQDPKNDLDRCATLTLVGMRQVPVLAEVIRGIDQSEGEVK